MNEASSSPAQALCVPAGKEGGGGGRGGEGCQLDLYLDHWTSQNSEWLSCVRLCGGVGGGLIRQWSSSLRSCASAAGTCG